MSDMSLTFRVQAEMAQAKAALQEGVAAFNKFGAGAKAAMREASLGNTALTNSFEVLRASIDPTFAAQQRYQAVQQELAGMVERGEASQAAANIVLEQAAAKYMGVATAADRAAAAQAEATAATAAAAREAEALQQRFTSLRASIDPAYAASLRFADAQAITQRAVAAGIATEAEAAAVLDGLRAKMDLAGDAAGRFAVAQTTATRSAQTNAMLTGNVAAQFNDIGVMLAAGQNPFQLAIQQGTQLSQVLNQVGGGAKGALAALKAGFMALLSPTTLVTMAVIAGGAALVQWATSADLAEEKSAEMKARIDELATALRELDATTTSANEPLTTLIGKYGDLAGAVREARLQLADRAFLDARGKFQGVVDDTNFGATMPLADLQALATAEKQIDAIRQKMAAARATAEAKGTFYDDTADSEALARLINRLQGAATYVGAIRDEFGLTQDQAQGLAEALARMNDAEDARAQVIAAKAFNAELIKVFGSARAADEATGGMVTALAEAIEKGAELASLSGQISGRFQEGDVAINQVRARLDEALASATALAEADIAGNISRALGPAAALAMRLWSAAGALAAFSDEQPALRGPAGMGSGDSAFASMRERRLSEEKARAEAWRAAWENGGGSAGGASGGSSGGGAAAGDSLADLSAEASKTMADLDLAIAAINEKVKAGLMTTAEAADAVQSAKAKAGDSVAELIAQIDRLGPAGAKAAEDLRRQLPGLAADLNKEVSDLSKTLSEGFASPFKDFIKGSIDAGTAFQKFGDAVIDKLLDMAAQRIELTVLQPLFDSLFSGFSFGAIPGHATGGEVIGKGTGTSDSNLRRLSHGEFVVNAAATARNKDALRAINAGVDVDLRPAPASDTPRGSGEVPSPSRSAGGLFQLFGAALPRGGADTRARMAPALPRMNADQLMRNVMASLPNPDPMAWMDQGKAAGSRAADPLPAPTVQPIVNITNTHPDAKVTQQGSRMQGGVPVFDVLIEQIESGLAGNVSRGIGPLNDVLTSTLGLKRQGR